VLQTVRGVNTTTKEWHTLKATIRGKALVVELDGKKVLDRQIDAAPSGRCGLWSKADSQVLFDDFEVEPLAKANE
jgi:hypothetical protein